MSSRSGLVESSATGAPISSSTRRTYLIACAGSWLQLRAPDAEAHAEAFARVCAEHGVGPDLRVAVSQVTVGERRLDTEDRVQLGAALLRDLVDAGL